MNGKCCHLKCWHYRLALKDHEQQTLCEGYEWLYVICNHLTTLNEVKMTDLLSL